ncbi:MAG TPA: Mur ligase domain-containing protein, partial [Verrucomicrobiota bacterium]|nr:Mur ligase domain-containing protein [Verrucomicrobiota bacterium]
MNCLNQNNMMVLPAKGENIYLIGAGGCGMSALGHILIDLGYRVSGSDIQLNKNIVQLKERGAKIFIGHNEKNIDETKPSLVIYSSAISSDNPELRRASQLSICSVKRGVFLSHIANETNLISVAGMHGKTTTASMLAWGFELLGRSIGYAIGWNVPQLKRHGKINCDSFRNKSVQENYFVIEADESDGTLNFYNPQHSIVLNIDREHMDYFGSF